MVPINGVLYAGGITHTTASASENTFEDGQRHFFNAEATADKKSQPWWPQANGRRRRGRPALDGPGEHRLGRLSVGWWRVRP